MAISTLTLAAAALLLVTAGVFHQSLGCSSSPSPPTGPTYKQSTTTTSALGAYQISWPAATQAGSLLYHAVVTTTANGVTPPAGWTLESTTVVGPYPGGGAGDNIELRVFVYPNAPSETVSPWSCGTTDGMMDPCGVAIEITGAAATAPLDVSSTNSGSGTTVSPGTTTATGHSGDIGVFAVATSGTVPTITIGSPYTQRQDQTNGASGQEIAGGTREGLASGATQTASATLGTGQVWAASLSCYHP